MSTTALHSTPPARPVTIWWRVQAYGAGVRPVHVVGETKDTITLRLRDRFAVGVVPGEPRYTTRRVKKHTSGDAYFASYTEARAAKIAWAQRDVALTRDRLQKVEAVLADCEALPDEPTAAMLATPADA